MEPFVSGPRHTRTATRLPDQENIMTNTAKTMLMARIILAWVGIPFAIIIGLAVFFTGNIVGAGIFFVAMAFAARNLGKTIRRA